MYYFPYTIFLPIKLFIYTMKAYTTAKYIYSAVALLFALSSPIYAQSYGSYGTGNGTEPNDLTINKTVYNPLTKSYVENLSITDATFSSGDVISYKLEITNGSGETMNPVTVVDTLPAHTTYYGGDGVYDSNSKTVKITYDNVIAGDKRTAVVAVKVNAIDTLPKTAFCVTNTVKVTSPTRHNGDDDSAQACIRTDILGASRLPTAGFNDLAMVLPFASLGMIGLYLTRKNA